MVEEYVNKLEQERINKKRPRVRLFPSFLAPKHKNNMKLDSKQ